MIIALFNKCSVWSHSDCWVKNYSQVQNQLLVRTFVALSVPLGQFPGLP